MATHSWLLVVVCCLTSCVTATQRDAINHSHEYALIFSVTCVGVLIFFLVACASCRKNSKDRPSSSAPISTNTSQTGLIAHGASAPGPTLPPKRFLLLNESAVSESDDPPPLRTKSFSKTLDDRERVDTAGPIRDRTITQTRKPMQPAPGVVYSMIETHRSPEPNRPPPPPPSASRSISNDQVSESEVNYAVLDFPAKERERMQASLTQPSTPPLPPKTISASNLPSKEEHRDVYGNAESILNSVVVPREFVEMSDRIDGGQFGDIYRGSLYRNGEETPAAIKVVKMMMDPTARKAFLEETSTMAQLKHQNVVQLIAVVEEPLLLVMELVNEGSALSYVRAHPNVPLPVLLKIATDSCAGLKYLHEHRLIHRDIAARNVLLHSSKSSFFAKIGDLGMARIGDLYTASPDSPLPIRWCAPESIFYGAFNSASDVWSFGIFLWELAANGQFPYSDYVNDGDLINAIEQNMRVYQPNNTPYEYYDTILKCCVIESIMRPTMANLLEMLTRMLRNLSVTQTPLSEDYEPIDPDASVPDLIVYARYTHPACVEYRPINNASSIEGLYERVSTFDNFVYRRARSRGVELFEASNRRARVVYAPILADELKPEGNLFVMKDKLAARSERIKRTHQLRSALEIPKQDPTVYNSAPATRKDRSNYNLPVAINLSTDAEVDSMMSGEFNNHSSGPELPVRQRDAKPFELSKSLSVDPRDDPDATLYRKPERRRVQSLSESSSLRDAPPLPARAPSVRPDESHRAATLRHSSVFDSNPNGEESRKRSNTLGRSAASRPTDADQLTASEWVNVQTWMNHRSVSRVQAEQLLMEKGLRGSYLIRRSERNDRECALSIRGAKEVKHYRLLLLEQEQVAMHDIVNGDRVFASMQSLIAFYKLLSPDALGGLIDRLAVCLNP